MQAIRGYEVHARNANAPTAGKGAPNLHGVHMPLVVLSLARACHTAEHTNLTALFVLNLRGRVFDA